MCNSTYPWYEVTDELNEVCICDEDNHYYRVTNSSGTYCVLDCHARTGDIYRRTPNNEDCTDCLTGMYYNASDDRCWEDCWTQGYFTSSCGLGSSYMWNNWDNKWGVTDGSHRHECLSCGQVGGI